ncbi:hypothetical protein TTHERM_01083080 (macronuclear) [Tetrahymena thermophila SB210]|uniref:Uncharacterized protein n=1 Tax=Tetrahymena thermophila (strain SB210) TaxID=312017 RepID=Q22BW0_TETTS|nr:hypothetical protein TTHERM_01083080 [Tetrahymena thermophila SB210]EAR82798.1 hypothetical protein TTHERM_01083080 [Tetrahymena thermophila SB210]|eukprot:XP_001030461.1 hypothetical protein TTHERM_01083080 [Tetrahymena thermophila SB210]
MLFARGADIEGETQTAATIESAEQMKFRRQQEKQMKKFQKIENKQNVREYEENFHSKNYTNIRSKVFQLRIKKVDFGGQKVTINDKVLINRRVLNDYIHIVNKRQDVVDSMEDNFWSMVQLYDGTLHYFNKYYGKKLEDQMSKLNHMLKPEHRYLLKSIDKNEARIKRRLLEYEQVKKSGDPTIKKALQECKNIEEIVEKHHQQQKQKAADRRNKNKSEGHIEKLSKKKGYIVNEMEVEQRRQNQMIMNEIQKFGSDRIKRKLFEQDMKVILENQEIQDKIHHIQMSLEKMQNQPATSSKSINLICENEEDPQNEGHNQNENTQKNIMSLRHINNPVSLQHINMVSPRSPRLDHLIGNKNSSSNLANNNSPYLQSAFAHNMQIQEHELVLNELQRRHSHNNLNPFIHYSMLSNKQATSPIFQQVLEQQSLHSKSLDKIGLNNYLDQNEGSEEKVGKKDPRSSIFNFQQNQKNQSQAKLNNLTIREQQFMMLQQELNSTSPHMKRGSIDGNNSPRNQPFISQLRNQSIFDNLSTMSQSKKTSILSANDSQNNGNSQYNGEKRLKSNVSFNLSSNHPEMISTPQKEYMLTEKYNKSTPSTSLFSNNQEQKSKFNQMNCTVGSFTVKENSQAQKTSKQNHITTNLNLRKASLDQVMGKINEEKLKKVAINIQSSSGIKEELLQSKSTIAATPLKSVLKKSHNNISLTENQLKQNVTSIKDVISTTKSLVTANGSFNFQNNQGLQESSNNLISDQNFLTSASNMQTVESPSKINSAKSNKQQGLIKRLTTLVSQENLAIIGNYQSKRRQSKSIQIENVSSNEKIEENPSNQPNITNEDKKQIKIQNDSNTEKIQQEASDDDNEDENKNNGSRQDTVSSRGNKNDLYSSREKKKRKSIIPEIYGKKNSKSADKVNSQQSEEVFEKPLIRNKIYNENDLFKYKKINKYALHEIYEKRILNLHKDETPLLSMKELQYIEEKQKKSSSQSQIKVPYTHHQHHPFSWNNLEEKKADFLSLEKQRSLLINPEQEEVFDKKISQIHGTDVFNMYKSIQKNCKTQIEQSKSFQKDIKEGEQELKFKHKILKQQYAEHLGPKEYKSKYVKEILDQTKKQLNFKINKKSRSKISSPEKILQSLLKQDKQVWGKTIKSQELIKDENGEIIQAQKPEKKYNLFSSQTMSDTEKQQVRNQSMQKLEKIVDKYKNNSMSLQEQLQSLMNLDNNRKALFGMTQKMYVPSNLIKNKQKNKYLNGILSSSNIDQNTFNQLKQQIANNQNNQSAQFNNTVEFPSNNQMGDENDNNENNKSIVSVDEQIKSKNLE